MVVPENHMQEHAGRDCGFKVGRAWLALCFALAVHVADEAMNGFLEIYNPTVIAIRESVPWLPLPVYRFDVWLTGLVIAIIGLFALSPFVFRGARWTRPAAYVFAIILSANAVVHTLGTIFGRTVESVRFSGPMPGVYSSPLLFAASLWLLLQLTSTRPVSAHGLSHQ